MARRLAAILAADVVGYSKLMAEDEAGTLAALKAHRRKQPDTPKTKAKRFLLWRHNVDASHTPNSKSQPLDSQKHK